MAIGDELTTPLRSRYISTIPANTSARFGQYTLDSRHLGNDSGSANVVSKGGVLVFEPHINGNLERFFGVNLPCERLHCSHIGPPDCFTLSSPIGTRIEQRRRYTAAETSPFAGLRRIDTFLIGLERQHLLSMLFQN